MADPAYEALMRSIGEPVEGQTDDPAYDALMRSIEGEPDQGVVVDPGSEERVYTRTEMLGGDPGGEEPVSSRAEMITGVHPVIGEAIEKRDTAREQLATATAKALYDPQGGGLDVPAAAVSGQDFVPTVPDVRGTIEGAVHRGLLPGGGMHVAKGDETLASVSELYNVPVESLARLNRIVPSHRLSKGESLRLPVSLSPEVASQRWGAIASGEIELTKDMTKEQRDAYIAMAQEAEWALADPTWGGRVRSFLGSVGPTGDLLAMPGWMTAATTLAKGKGPGDVFEEVMGIGAGKSPTGRTIHRPTMLSTTMDFFGLPQRVAVTVPLEIFTGDRPEEAWWQSLGHAAKFPSWSEGTPRDNLQWSRRAWAELGYDPNAPWAVAASLGAAFADPVFLIGGARAPATLQAVRQATRVARRGLRQLGQRGQALNQNVAAFSRNAEKAVREAGNLGKARPAVRSLISDEVGGHAVKAFDDVGLAWGEPDVLGGLPGLRGREGRWFSWIPGAGKVLYAPITGPPGTILGNAERAMAVLSKQRILAKSETIEKAKRAIGRGMGRLPLGEQAGTILASMRRALDPAAMRSWKRDPKTGVLSSVAPPESADPVVWADWYRQSLQATMGGEHLENIAGDHVVQVARQYSYLSRKVTAKTPKKNPVLLSTGDLADWKLDPHLAVQAEREYAMARMNWTMRRATERWAPNQYAAAVGVVGDGTLLPNPSLTDGVPLEFQSEASRLIRQAYSSAQTSGAKGVPIDDVVDAFGSYVSKGLRSIDRAKNQKWSKKAADAIAVDLEPRVKTALQTDAPNYMAVEQAGDIRMDNLVGFHRDVTEGTRNTERQIVLPLAKRVAQQAAIEARMAGRAAGLTKKQIKLEVKKASSAAFQNSMSKVGGYLDNHFTHIIRNKDAVMRRVPLEGSPSGASPTAKREFVDIIENYEHGQDPVTDLLVTTAARIEASARFRSQVELAELVVSDSRWAVPVSKSTKELRAKHGWHEWAHPITDEKYMVRQEVIADVERAIEGYSPGGIDGLISMIAEKVPWLGTIGSGWKARVTHGRPLYYNARNLPDDAFRMWMGGYDGDPRTAKEALFVGLQGHLERRAAVRPRVVAGRRRPMPTQDQLEDSFEGWLRNPNRPKIVQKSTGEEATDAEAYAQAIKYGIVDKGMVPMELTDVSVVQGLHAKRYSPLDLGVKDLNPLHRDHLVVGEGGFYLRTTGNVARKAENMRRLTTFLSNWKRGDTWQEAAVATQKWMFNYGEQTDWIRKWVKPLVPFVNFTTKAIPAHVKGMRMHPGRYLGVTRAMRSVDEVAESKLGPASVIPDYIDGANAFRWPVQTKRGADVFVGVGLSMNEIDLFDPLLSGTYPTRRTGVFDDVTPVVDAVQVMYTGRDPRTGKMLSSEWAEPDASLLAFVEAWNAIPGQRRAAKVPTRTRVKAGGKTYLMLPAALVWSWDKWLPNLISVSKTMFPRDDPFQQERQPYDKFKQLTGISPMVVSSIKAEYNALQSALRTISPSITGANDPAPLARHNPEKRIQAYEQAPPE